PGVAATSFPPTVSPVTAAFFPAMPSRTPTSTLRIVAAPPKSDNDPTTARASALVLHPLPLRPTDEAVSTDPSPGYAPPSSLAPARPRTPGTGRGARGGRPGRSSAKPASTRQRGVATGVATSSFPAERGFGFGGGAVVAATVVVVVDV